MEAASNAGENEGIAPASKQQGLEKDSTANGETRRLIFLGWCLKEKRGAAVLLAINLALTWIPRKRSSARNKSVFLTSSWGSAYSTASKSQLARAKTSPQLDKVKAGKEALSQKTLGPQYTTLGIDLLRGRDLAAEIVCGECSLQS